MKFFVRRDLDGFFGLFIDNLVQLLLIVALCSGLCGMNGDKSWLIYGRILPGAAVSILLGNLFYAGQARRLARRLGRDDVTALPYGINTPSLLVYIFFVMAPTYARTHDAELAWKTGLLACLGSGVIEFSGAFVAEWIRRRTPRAALLSTLAGIAIGFISMTFALEIWTQPLIALVPLGIVLLTLFGRLRFPLGLPGGLVAMLAGTVLAWLLPEAWTGRHMQIAGSVGFSWPQWCGGALLDVFGVPAREWLGFMSVIIPMGLFNVLGSLQNIESAEAAGDTYTTWSSLAANGLGTIAAALFGSCFPTTIYIGHPGWKALGSRAGYSTLNGVVITAICLTGTLALVSSVVPIQAGIAIVLWIGVVITAQAFQATPTRHAPAVALGLFPAIAAWGATLVFGAVMTGGGATLENLLTGPGAALTTQINGFLLHGLIVMERGYIFTCMALAAIGACLIERKFYAAAIWSALACLFTLAGLTHAYALAGNSVDYLLIFTRDSAAPIQYRAYAVAAGYAALAVLFALAGIYAKAHGSATVSAGHE